MEFELLQYLPAYQPHFEQLNKVWIEKYFTLEDLDKWVLEQPAEAIIDKGGKIYFAALDGVIIGTVA